MLDIEKQLTDELAHQIAEDIDRQIMNDFMELFYKPISPDMIEEVKTNNAPCQDDRARRTTRF